MNCRRIEKRLALYVEGDLESPQAGAVADHLKGCPACSRLAGEYADSQQWLRSSAGPEVDGDFFADLRVAVAAQVRRQRSGASLRDLMIGRWRGRWALAAAAAILIAGALVLYWRFSRTTIRVDTSEAHHTPAPAGDGTTKVEEHAIVRDENGAIRVRPRPASATDHLIEQPPIIEAVEPDWASPQSALDPDLIGELAVDDALGLAPDPADQMAGVEAEPLDPAARIWPSGSIDSSRRMNSDPELTTRIEFQTSDPTIRIIWFAPKGSGPNSPRTAADTE